MKINAKIILMSVAILMLIASILSVFMYISLTQYSDNEIKESTETQLRILETEYEYRFENMELIAQVLSKNDAFIHKNQDESAALLQDVVKNSELDFGMVINPDLTTFYRTNSKTVGDSVPFADIVESVMHGESIATTEIVSPQILAKENIATIITGNGGQSYDNTHIKSAMMQLYFTPIYDNNGSIVSALVLGRLINGDNELPDEIDYQMFEGTNTMIYQNAYVVATSSSQENIALIGTTMSPKIMLDLQAHSDSFGDLEGFSSTHVYAASPIENNAGDVIGALMITSPKAPYLESMNQAKISIFYAVIIGLFSSISIITFWTRSITKPLKELDDAAKYVASMSGYKNVEITTNDEIADVARSFNMMVDSLKEIDEATKNNTEELLVLNSTLNKQTAEIQKKQIYDIAYSDILTSVSKTIDLNTIMKEGLNNLMKYTKSPIGVFYLYNSNTQMLLPAVTQGTTRDVSEHSYALGEGIPGETALKRNTIILSDMPPDNIYKIDTGVYNAHPGTIVSTPMIYEDKLIGVMITCHLGNVSEDMVNFIKRVVNQYAIAITNSNIYMESQYMAGELKKQRDELDAKSKELIIASKTKSEFLANMSHELRTPLNSIIGFSEILHDETFGSVNAKQSKYLNNILTSGKHLLQLINNILDLSKIEAGKMDLSYEMFSVSDAINEIITLTSPLASKKSIEVTTVVEPELTVINADLAKFKQILFNLISNSIKFTPESGTLLIKAQRAGDMAQISVTDTGIGLSKENQKKIFMAFTQADASTSRQYGGTGLGLSLVKQFVNIHGGDIWVESEPDKGSTFTFTIPINKKVKDSDIESIEKSEVSHIEKVMATEIQKPVEVAVESIDASITQENIDKIEMPAIIEPKDAVGDETLILVVEDNRGASEILINMIIEAGYRAVPAYTGIEALAIAQKLKPLAITLDIMLPGMDGWAVLKHLKEKSETSGIPVIIISMIDEKDIGFVLGAADYFIKPVQKNILIASLNNIRDSLSTKNPKVLIVDDDADFVDLISSMLEPTGFEILCAYSGQEGLDKAVSEKPDVLILDLVMPIVNGFEVVAQLKNNPDTVDMPIIICTSKDYDQEMKPLADKVSRIIQKGIINSDELIDAIKKSITLRRNKTK